MINKKIYKKYKKIYIILNIPNNGIIWDLTTNKVSKQIQILQVLPCFYFEGT